MGAGVVCGLCLVGGILGQTAKRVDHAPVTGLGMGTGGLGEGMHGERVRGRAAAHAC